MVQKRAWAVESSRGLGAVLRALREGEGLTQQQVANELGTSRHRLARMEDGEFTDQVMLLLRLLRRFGVSLRVESK